jgi:hypothetical protein
MMSVPVGGYGAGSSAAGAPNRQRMATEQWEIEEGVPPVIGEMGPFFVEPEEVDEDERLRVEFEGWYNRLMLPWNEG